jgi:hypothetical protein
MTDNISGLRSFEVKVRPGGSLGVCLERQYATDYYLLDLDQAEALGKSLTEMTTGLRKHPWAAADCAD